MNILILSHNYPPDLGAASFRMKALVDELDKRGHKVKILTSVPNRYKNIKLSENNLTEKENVIRVRCKPQSSNLVKRSFSYIGYFLRSFFVGLKEAKDTDVIVATSPQILVGYLGVILSKLKKKPLVVDIRDLWPDAMVDLEITTENSMVYKIIKRIEMKMYRTADKIVINSPSFEKHVEKYKRMDTSIDIVTNGLDDYIFDYFEKKDTKTGNQRLNVCYAGNLGIAQDINILTKIAKKMENEFEFILIGNGSQKPLIERNIVKNGIKNIKILQPMDRRELLGYYEKADIFFVHLKNIPMFEKTIPSKIFEYVATKKPLVYGLTGVSKTILDELNAGFSFGPNNIGEIENSFYKAKETVEKDIWKAEGISVLREKYTRSELSRKFADVIEECVKNR